MWPWLPEEPRRRYNNLRGGRSPACWAGGHRKGTGASRPETGQKRGFQPWGWVDTTQSGNKVLQDGQRTGGGLWWWGLRGISLAGTSSVGSEAAEPDPGETEAAASSGQGQCLASAAAAETRVPVLSCLWRRDPDKG